MKKKTLKRKRKIKRVEETKKNSSRKVSAPRKTIHHQMRMKTMIVQKEYSSWK
jgi:hypothetical protein